MKNKLLSLVLIALSFSGLAAIWEQANQSTIKQLALETEKKYGEYSLINFDKSSFFSKFNQQATIDLPLPNGQYESFELTEVAIMEPELAAKFPNIRTYRGKSLKNDKRLVLDVTPKGLNAVIYSSSGNVWIQPFSKSDSVLHISYFETAYRLNHTHKTRSWQCLTEDLYTFSENSDSKLTQESEEVKGNNLPFNQSTLRTYRLAVAATGEYTAFHGGTVASGMAAIVTTMNRVNGIYEAEVGIRMILVANNDAIIFTNPETDGYSNFDGLAMLTENQTIIDDVIKTANYDIGHVFSTGGGGIAGLGVPCLSGLKAEGVTGLSSPINDVFDVDYVAHELGHQWGANHTFNSVMGGCDENRYGPAAVEPGSGSTIMGYAGLCDSDNLQFNSDPYFNSHSLGEMLSYATSTGNCSVNSATNNLAPTIDAGANHTIPHSTPFKLCAQGLDTDSTSLTYSWEQNDVGTAGSVDEPSGNVPIFRSYNPTTDNCRVFPKMSDILNQTSTFGETLPNYARGLNFRVTARDNEPNGGAISTDDMFLTVTENGPFALTSHNSGSFSKGLNSRVSWNEAGTSSAPVSCPQVNISVSTDGGQTFMLDSGSPFANSGSAVISLPDIETSQGRILIECSNNVFFTVSSSNLTFTVDLIFANGFESSPTLN